MSFEIAYDFEALISLSGTEDGGRKKPVYTGYRPSFSFNTVKHFCGEIELLSTNELKPGKDATALIKLLPSQNIRKTLRAGHTFSILEGNKTIGMGVIKKIKHKIEVASLQA